MLEGIEIGELDTRIRVESYSTSNHTTTNQEVKTWATLKTIWAKELGPSSREKFEAKQQVAIDETRFLVRSGAAFSLLTADNSNITVDNTQITADNFAGTVRIIDEKMRVVRRGEVLYISGIEGTPRRGYVILKAVKRDNG
ncbi:MAG TPA: head-tail adaptor protein [Chryseosolibacter sp.]|nr:head-tail adaptor protein [Chryseosolibacter sp.]